MKSKKKKSHGSNTQGSVQKPNRQGSVQKPNKQNGLDKIIASLSQRVEEIAREQQEQEEHKQEVQKRRYKLSSTGMENLKERDSREYKRLQAVYTDLQAELAERGYFVEIIEDIDVLDVMDGRKYLIRLYGGNGSFAEIDYFKYRSICLDSTQDIYAYVREFVKRMAGIMGESDEAAVLFIVAFLSYAYYYKKCTSRFMRV